MRLARLFLVVVIVAATLGLPAKLSCVAAARQAAILASCCDGAAHCCPPGHCACVKRPQNEPDTAAVAAPTSLTDASLLVVTPVAPVNASDDTGPTTGRWAQAAVRPSGPYVSCLSNRAPPLS